MGNIDSIESPMHQLEVSVSPSGENILDQHDLDEIARMLGQDKSPDAPKQLSDFLTEVDELGDRTVVDFMINGAYHQCILRKSTANSDLYTISKQGAQISVTRSRLGLALAMQSGELRYRGQELNREAGQRTILESSARTHH